MIRPVTPDDSLALVALSSSSGLFRPDELGTIQGMLDEYHANVASNGHQILTYDEGGTLVGMVYFVPKEFTDRVWELLMIAVGASRHRQGIGSKMLLAVEVGRELNPQGTRSSISTTSSILTWQPKNSGASALGSGQRNR